MVKVAQLVDQRRNIDVVVIIKVAKPPAKAKSRVFIISGEELQSRLIKLFIRADSQWCGAGGGRSGLPFLSSPLQSDKVRRERLFMGLLGCCSNTTPFSSKPSCFVSRLFSLIKLYCLVFSTLVLSRLDSDEKQKKPTKGFAAAELFLFYLAKDLMMDEDLARRTLH